MPMDGVIKEVKMGMGRMGVAFLENEEIGNCLISGLQMTKY